MSQNEAITTPDGTLSFKVRDFIGITIFLIAVGITIGTYKGLKQSVDTMQECFNKIDEKYDNIGQRVSNLEGWRNSFKKK